MSSTDNRVGFIQWIIGEEEVGYVGLAARISDTNDWIERIIEYPKNLTHISEFIVEHELTSDLYFCPTILDDDRRVKENIKRSSVLWSDLDECHPKHLLVEPTVVIETSPNRYQAYWKLDSTVHADSAELINKRIALFHKDQGADISGWDLSQLLRIPNTRNFKYDDTPAIKTLAPKIDNVYKIDAIENFYDSKDVEIIDIEQSPIPTILPDLTADEILNKIINPNPRIWTLYENEPVSDRSKALWELLLTLIESDLSKEETYIVATTAACNKFEKPHHLWRDIIRAEAKVKRDRIKQGTFVSENEVHVPNVSILTEHEIRQAIGHKTIIDDYCDWAMKATDAAPQYHAGIAITVLSCLLSSTLRLYTQFGEIKPNIWLMIMGDTTTSRKSTSMEMGTDIIDEIHPEALLATDGTIEGLITSIASRPGRVSLFHRDEVSGLMEAMVKKDYNAGMMEAFTKLYDGKRMKRILRKEQIDVRDPVFIMLTGGTKEGIMSALTVNHIRSGFAPRFCYISAQSDPSRRRGLGPKTPVSIGARADLVFKLEGIFEAYNQVDNSNPFDTLPTIEVQLNEQAWATFNKFDAALMDIADRSSVADHLTPMLARLSMSGLKISMLIAAARLWNSDAQLIVTVDDILKAFYYINLWKEYSIEVVLNAGRTDQERLINDAYTLIMDAGAKGISRPNIMQILKLTSRNADLVFGTLEQRGLVFSNRVGKRVVYFTHKEKVSI